MSTMTTTRTPAPVGEGLTRLLARMPETARQAALAEGPLGDPRRETPAEVAARVTAQAANRAKRWRDALPVMFAQASLAQIPADTRAGVSAWLADDDALTLGLAGDVGVGKTHTAYAAANAQVAAGRWVEAWTLHGLLAAMRPDADPRAYDRATSCGVLLLDDFGATKASDWAQETMTALMDARLNNHLRTIITTNNTYADLAEVWNARLMDRLQYRASWVVMRGESRRRPTW